MAESKEQKETIERVMHDFKHRELETGTGKKVTNPKQAIAIGLREAGASKYASDEENAENLKRTKNRERRGETAMDETEDGSQAQTTPDHAKNKKASTAEQTKGELYEEAKERDIPGPSKMSKEELERALKK